ncbi:protein Wnt-9a [Biomphalaria pfeifferi]|uniref:Protein Wnt n=1 Tax=Biomphalaria pfeifferi TaxID=112525 RepID=A0AAD8F3H8_BIOPF|nr:protein Wnt-9a [Biomphalaria pfeifferi]
MRCRSTSLVLQLSTLFLLVGLTRAFYGLTARETYLTLNPNYQERMSDIKKITHEDYCNSLGLHRKQKRVCRKGKGMAEMLVRATRLAALECQHQFLQERWNCSLGSYRKHLLEKGFKETAFLFAISSAGLVHEVSRSCAQGILHRCTCDETEHLENRETWLWGGCGDNIKFGLKFTRKFLRRFSNNDKDIRAKVDDHNTEAGIKTVKDLVNTTCKCHGVSGSCTVKTCWLRLSPFKTVGNVLKAKYERSAKVIHVTNQATGVALLKKQLQSFPEEAAVLPVPSKQSHLGDNIANDTAPLRKSDLTYIEDSPSFCRETRYSPGTVGRSCIKGENCDSICCGRGHNVQKKKFKRACRCEVIWCCVVKCKECPDEQELYLCK